MCVEVIWIHGENGGGLVGEENSKIQYERCEVERKVTEWMDGMKRTLNEKSNVRGVRKDDFV